MNPEHYETYDTLTESEAEAFRGEITGKSWATSWDGMHLIVAVYVIWVLGVVGILYGACL